MSMAQKHNEDLRSRVEARTRPPEASETAEAALVRSAYAQVAKAYRHCGARQTAEAQQIEAEAVFAFHEANPHLMRNRRANSA